MGLSVQNHGLAQQFADLSSAVEKSVYGKIQGRGVHIPVIRAPLQVQGRPGAGWGGRQCAFWGRVVSWLESCQKSLQPWPFGTQMLPSISQFWHGQQDHAKDFTCMVAELLGRHSVEAVPPLLQVAQQQLQQHTRLVYLFTAVLLTWFVQHLALVVLARHRDKFYMLVSSFDMQAFFTKHMLSIAFCFSWLHAHTTL